MDYAVHLPVIALDGRPWSLRRLLKYAELAEGLGFGALSANDHLLFPRPWLDGPTALAAVLTVTERITLATTVALPTVRGPLVSPAVLHNEVKYDELQGLAQRPRIYQAGVKI